MTFNVNPPIVQPRRTSTKLNNGFEFAMAAGHWCLECGEPICSCDVEPIGDSYAMGLCCKHCRFLIFQHAPMSAIAGQVANFTRNRRLGYPIVTLSTGSYKNKKHGGFTSFPAFVTVGYDTPPAPAIANGGNGGDDARVIGASKVRDREVDGMEDIPF
jgi:hypothetical protein